MNSTTQFLPGFESLMMADPHPSNTANTHAPRGLGGKRGVRYSASTEQIAGSNYVRREFRAAVWTLTSGDRCVSVKVQADASDRIGYHFGSMLVRSVDGNYVSIGMDAEQMRSVAAALLAAANSCGAKWRK